MFPSPLGIAYGHFIDFLEILALHFDRNRQPERPVGGLDEIAISPVPDRVLHVIVEDELVDGINQVEVTPPWDVIGLDDGDSFGHGIGPDWRKQSGRHSVMLKGCSN